METRAFTITLGAPTERGVVQQLSILVAGEHRVVAQHLESCPAGVAAGMQSAKRSNSTAPVARTENTLLDSILTQL
jgi:hypothetical protein